MCKFIWEWIYAKQIATGYTSLAVFFGGQQFNSLASCPIGTNFGSRLRIHLGMDIGYMQVAHQYPRGHFWGGGVGCHKLKKSGEAGTKFGTHLQIHLGMDIRQRNCSSRQKVGHLGGGVRGQTFKRLGKLSNGWTDWHQLWFSSADSSGNGHRLNPSRPSIPQGAFGGGEVRGSKIPKSEEAVKRLHQLAPNLVHVGGFV